MQHGTPALTCPVSLQIFKQDTSIRTLTTAFHKSALGITIPLQSEPCSKQSP